MIYSNDHDGECVSECGGTGESITKEVSSSDQAGTGQLRKKQLSGNISSNDDENGKIPSLRAMIVLGGGGLD